MGKILKLAFEAQLDGRFDTLLSPQKNGFSKKGFAIRSTLNWFLSPTPCPKKIQRGGQARGPEYRTHDHNLIFGGNEWGHP